jgi:hypothetical protein
MPGDEGAVIGRLDPTGNSDRRATGGDFLTERSSYTELQNETEKLQKEKEELYNEKLWEKEKLQKEKGEIFWKLQNRMYTCSQFARRVACRTRQKA